MLSKYTVKAEIDNNIIALYNSLKGDPVFLSLDEYADILSDKVTTEIRKLLLRKGIFINNEGDDLHLIGRVENFIRNRVGNIEFVMVMLTNYCNLSCDYCIEKKYTSKQFSDQSCLTEKTIDLFFNMLLCGSIHISPKAEFVLYGGEPLLNFDGIRYFIEKKKSLPLAHCSLVTNAILLDDSIIAFLKKEDVYISISIDGPKEITDEHRKLRNSNQSVFDKVQETIIRLKRSGAMWGMSITVTNELIMKKDVFYSWLEEVRPKNVSFNLLKLAFKSRETKMAIEYYRRASEFLVETHLRLMSIGITVRDISRKIKFFTGHQPVFSDCAAASINQITLDINGDIHSCQCDMNKSNLFGNVFKPDSFEIPTECIRMFKNLPIFKEQCLKCLALPVCGGGCLVQGKVVFNNDHYTDMGNCEHAKNIMYWILKRIYQSAQD